MWGAVIGDLAGSIYEYEQHKNVSLIRVNNLIEDDSFFTDDTIMTVAIYDAILRNGSYENYLKSYVKRYLKYQPDTSANHFSTIFGKRFVSWATENGKNDSIGNGAMMRISGIGKMFNREEDVIENALLATKPSHNSMEAIYCSRIVALVIFYARMGYNKGEILDKVGFKTFDYRPFEHFNSTCFETLENCLYVTFSSNSFEEAVRKAVDMGGDTDTDGAIVGSMAEALYGVPEYLVNKARKKLPRELSYVLDEAYRRI